MIKSSAARFRFGSATLLALLAVNGSAAEAVGEAWLEQSRKILEGALLEAPPDWLRTAPGEKDIELAQQIARESVPEQLRLYQQRQRAQAEGKTIIFGSLSLPRPTLLALLEEASESDVVFVLRGVMPGKSLQDTVRSIGRLAQEIDKTPHVIVDPTLFKRHGVSVVPTFVMQMSDGRHVRLEGAVTLSFFTRLASTADPAHDGALGRRGETHEIGEADLVEEMQQRLAAINWEEKKKEAVDRFWAKKNDFVDLPDAHVSREFAIDPSVRVTEDLHDADGKLLISAGDTINPLSWAPLSKTVIAFRGTNARHLERALEAARAVRATGRGVILLTSRIDTSNGWASLTKMEKELQGVVYLLPRVLAERFHLERLPATIHAKDKQLIVTELALEDS